MWTLTICTIILSFIIDGRCLKFGDSYETPTHTNLKSKERKNIKLAAQITPECIGEPGFDRSLQLLIPDDKWNQTFLTWKVEGRPRSGLSLETVRLVIYYAFKVWSKPVSNLIFSQVSSHSKAHFTIKFVRRYHGDGYNFDGKGGTIAHAFYPRSGQIHFDDDEWWTAPIKFLNKEERHYHDPRWNSDSTNLLAVAVHEIGHALGLPHNNADRNSIMFPYYNPEHEEPKLAETDIRLMRYLYGFGKPICNPNAFTSKISKPKPSNNESQKTNNYQKVLENDLSLVRNGSSLPNNEREQETTDYFPSNKIGTIIERTSSRSSSCPSLRDMDNFQRMMKQKSAMDRNHSDHQIFSDDIDMIYANRGKESYFLQSPNFHLNQNRRTVSRKTAVPQTGKRNVRFNNNDFEDQKRDSFGHLPHQITYYRENCIDDHAIHHQYQRRNPNLHNTYHTNTNNEELRLSMDNPAFVEDPLSEEYKNGTAKSLNRVNYHHWSRNYETENDDYCKIFVISIVFLVGMIVLTAVGLFLSVYYDK